MSGRYPSFFGGVQVPELDVAVSRGDEVAAVLGEGDGEHAARHFVGGDDGTFLKSKRTVAVTNVTSSQSQRVTFTVFISGFLLTRPNSYTLL